MDSLFDTDIYDRLGLLGNDEEALDMVSYHARLLTAHLGTSYDLLYFYQGFPWRCAAALLGKNLQAVLSEMRAEWDFVLSVLDPLVSNSRFHKMFAHTRYQCYRDLMTKAECLAQ